MLKLSIYLLIFCLYTNSVFSQVINDSLYSQKLGDYRSLKIQLPRGYSDDDEKRYPLVVVLDGDYLFEIVAGNTDYYSYWEDIPDVIVVGIKQADTRFEDNTYNKINSLPTESGARFFEFLGVELLPHIKSNFKTLDFNIAVGHGESANFINYYLLKPDPIFKAYAVISPYFAPAMSDFVTNRLKQIKSPVFYYLATSEDDIYSIKKEAKALDETLAIIKNESVFYNFDILENVSHYNTPAHAIPKALESIFFVYQPISRKEYKESVLNLKESPIDYLKEKYQTIEKFYGIKKPYLVNDIRAIAAAIEKNKKFDYFEDLGKLVQTELPFTVLGYYYLGRYYEETDKPRKAMDTYNSAYSLEEIGGITNDYLIERATQIKSEYGF